MSLFGATHDAPAPAEVHEGDRVATGPNSYPTFVVVAIRGDRAWIRSLEGQAQDAIASLARLRPIAGEG